MLGSDIYARSFKLTDYDVSPAEYDTNYKFGSDSPRFTIKHRPDQPKKDINIGYYDVPEPHKPGRITIGVKTEIKPKETSPGPKYVTPTIGYDGKKPTMHNGKAKLTFKDASDIGPAGYDVRTKPGAELPKYTLHYRPDENRWMHGPDTPGPGQYEASPRPTPHLATISAKYKAVKSARTPGPADYSIPSDFATKPKAYFHTRSEIKTEDPSPGPAAHLPLYQLGENSPRWKIGNRIEPRSARPTGEYLALPSKVGEGPHIRIAPKYHQKKKQTSPGPSYIPKTFGSDGAKPTIHLRTESVPIETSPGPGAINVSQSISQKTPKVYLHGRVGNSWAQPSDTPGPGAYRPGSFVVHKTGQTISPRTDKKRVVKGVGYYNLPSTMSNPRITIGRRETCNLVPIK